MISDVKLTDMQNEMRRLMRDPNLLPSEKQTLLSDIAAQAAAMDMPCYIVGGFVRDLLLGSPVNDLDIIVEGDAIQFGESLVKKHGGKLTPHTKFHTAIWHLPSSFNIQPSSLDLITARKETYSNPGALPVVSPSSIEDDLLRRDFTVNAMAIRLDGDHFGELLDPLNGQADLYHRAIRVLHPRSFMDDPTRIFRAIRYEARYSFNLEPSTLDLITPDSLSILSRLSGERIRHELDLIFNEERSFEMIQRAGDLGLFGYIHSDLPLFNPAYAELLDADPILGIPADRVTMGYMLWLISLLEAGVQFISWRLAFSSNLEDAVSAAARLSKSLPFLVGFKPSEWTFAIEKLPLLSIYAVYLVTGEHALLDYLSIWRHVKPRTTGEDLKLRGLQPGPHFREILIRLRAAWLDGEVKSFDDELRLLETLIK